MVTKYALKNYNKDRDVEGSESNGKDSSEDDGEDNNKDNGKDKEFQDKIDIDLDKPAKTLYYKHVTLILLRKPKAKRDLLTFIAHHSRAL